MRIIDKNHDYYDYLQDPTDTLVFDRRGSFLLEKKHICEKIYLFNNRNRYDNRYAYIELQCGPAFWIFLVTITKFEKESYCGNIVKPVDYDIELASTWKDYNLPNKLLDINLVGSPSQYNWKTKTYELDKDDALKNAKIHFYFGRNYNSAPYNIGTLKTSIDTKNGYKEIKYTIPLLNASGIANLIPPLDIFCAIEEYFSIEKSSAEKTEPVGATNNDKIIMHGFDTKTSFRGKQ